MKLLLEWDGGSIVLPPNKQAVIGRDNSADIQITNAKISRSHARIEFKANKWHLTDLDSSNGTYINGKNINTFVIEKETLVYLGSKDVTALRCLPLNNSLQLTNDKVSIDETRISKRPSLAEYEEEVKTARIRLNQRIRIGRDPENDWLVEDLTASRFHAEIALNGSGGYDLVDLKSANGTFKNGVPIKRSTLEIGDLVSIGNATRRFTSDGLEQSSGVDGVAILARNISFAIGNKKILDDVNFNLGPRSLTAIIGPSGAGKSTLLSVLTGRQRPTGGTITVGGRDLVEEYSELKNRIGLVPQADILHTRLTVKEALTYGAKLRFPDETKKSERVARVMEVMEKLELTPRADLRIDKLSGGQRKRASIGLELLTKPAILVLDEPTSGLDPGLDAHVMQTLRTLADDGQTVIVVTHSVDNLNFCDNVILMASGGRVAYAGPASTVFTALGKESWAEVFRMLASEEATMLQTTKFSSLPNDPIAIQKNESSRQNWFKQTATLSSRYMKVIASDKYFLALLILVPIITGLLCLVTGSRDGFGVGKLVRTGIYFNSSARTSIMVLILGCVFIGLSTSIQEVIKEVPIFLREKSIGVRTGTYLVSKIVVLGVISILQSSVFISIMFFNRTMPSEHLILSSGYAELIVLGATLGFVSMCLGLLVSSLLSSSEQAMPILVALTMVQVILSGALPTESGGLVDLISPISPSYWAMRGLAAITDLLKIQRINDPHLEIIWAPSHSIVISALTALFIAGGVLMLTTQIKLYSKK